MTVSVRLAAIEAEGTDARQAEADNLMRRVSVVTANIRASLEELAAEIEENTAKIIDDEDDLARAIVARNKAVSQYLRQHLVYQEFFHGQITSYSRCEYCYSGVVYQNYPDEVEKMLQAAAQ